ncbi:MAG: hypothetical protein ISS36_00790 [Candidatus Aenigmarchaeota archaeon]|nr:hypothetical protein [Candidatus Aenigmarchaeota archaeon]
MLGEITGLIAQLFQLNPIIAGVILVAFVFLAYKTFQYVTKAIFTGIAFAFLPLGLNYIGFGIPLTITSILWFALAGVVFFFVFSAMNTSYKILRIILSPFSRAWKKKQKDKVIVKVVKEKEEKS